MKNSKDDLTFRRADLNDLETLVDLRVRFLNGVYDHAEDEEAVALRKRLAAYFARALAKESFVAWLALREGRVVATSGLVLWRIPGRYAGALSGKMGYLLNFYTLPEARKRGICRRLMEELIREARARGVTELQLHATQDGIRIYRDLGFREPDLPVLEMNLTG